MRQKILGWLLSLVAFFATSQAYAEKVTFTTDNFVLLRGEVNEMSIAKTMVSILASKKSEIYLFISSPGGSIIDGMRLVSLLKSTDKKITCVTNMAASMAFVIMQACGKRYVTEDAIMMQHVASYTLRGPDPNNWSMVNFIRSMVKKMDVMQAKRIGISYKALKEKSRDDWWLFGDESVAQNTADKVVEVTCDHKLSSLTDQEKVAGMFWSFDVTWSRCPIIEGPLDVKASQTSGFLSPEADAEYKKTIEGFNVRTRLMKRFGDSSVELPELFK